MELSSEALEENSRPLNAYESLLVVRLVLKDDCAFSNSGHILRSILLVALLLVELSIQIVYVVKRRSW